MSSLTFDDISVGDTAEVTKTISESDVYLFAGITGDLNPAHTNEEWARNTVFGRRIVHGMLVCGLISNVLGNQLPGHGTIYMSQSVRFLAPVYFGDTITARVEVVEKKEKKRVLLKTICMNQKGENVVEGEALVSPPRRQSE